MRIILDCFSKFARNFTRFCPLYERLKIFRKDSAMKIILGSISSAILLFLRLCLPAAVFIGLCAGIFVAFQQVLLMLDQIAPGFSGVAWLSLLVLYIILGIAFTYLMARFLLGSYR